MPNLNPLRKQHFVEIGGRNLPLRFEHRDFARAEGRLGMALLGPPAAEFWSKAGPAYQTGVLLFVGLLHALPQLTLEQAQDMITFENAAEIEQAVFEAFSDALRIPGQRGEKEAAADGPLPGTTTGSESGSSPGSTSGSQIEISGG